MMYVFVFILGMITASIFSRITELLDALLDRLSNEKD